MTLSNTSYYAAAQKLTFSVRGLRPATAHSFFYDSVDQSAYVRPIGGNLGDTLVSAIDGTLSFHYYYGSGITGTSDIATQQDSLNRLAGTKTAVVKTSDNSSYAAVTLGVLQANTPVSGVSTGGLYSSRILSGS